MRILIRPIPGRRSREHLFKLIDHLGVGENALRPFRRDGNLSTGGEVIECSRSQYEQLRNNSACEGDFIAYRESTGGKLTRIYPVLKKQPLKPRVTLEEEHSAQSRRRRVTKGLAVPGVMRAKDLPPPRTKKHA